MNSLSRSGKSFHAKLTLPRASVDSGVHTRLSNSRGCVKGSGCSATVLRCERVSGPS